MLKIVYHPLPDTVTLYNDTGGWISIPREELQDAVALLTSSLPVKPVLDPHKNVVGYEVVQ